MRAAPLLIALSLVAISAACDEDPPKDAAPAAPEDLEASVVSGGAHLTWTDASDDEDEFVVERRTENADFAEVATVPFDTNQHHDEPGAAGRYIYRVMARNDTGEASSNEVTVDLP